MQTTSAFSMDSFIAVGRSLYHDRSLHVYPISKEQDNLVKLYTGEKIQHQISRVIKFYRTTDNGIRIIEEVSKAAIKGGVVGFCVSSCTYFLGREVFAFFRPDLALASRAMSLAYSLMWGAAGGVSSAASYGTLIGIRNICKDVRSEEYSEWKKQSFRSNVLPIYKDVLKKSDLRLRNFLCPITGDLILCPYKTKTGKVYEKSAILAIIEEKREHVQWLKSMCHSDEQREELDRAETEIMGENIHKEDLSYDWRYHSLLLKRLNEIIDENSENFQNSIPDFVVIGLKKYKESIKIPASQIVEDLFKMYLTMYTQGIIDREDFEEKTHDLSLHYQPFIPTKTKESITKIITEEYKEEEEGYVTHIDKSAFAI